MTWHGGPTFEHVRLHVQEGERLAEQEALLDLLCVCSNGDGERWVAWAREQVERSRRAAVRDRWIAVPLTRVLRTAYEYAIAGYACPDPRETG